MQRAHAIQQSPCGLLAEHSGRRDAEGSGCRSTVGRRRRRRRRRGRTRRRRSAVTPMLIARLCRVEFFQPAGRPRQPGHETDFAPPPAECRQQHLPESRACPSWLRGPAVQQRIRLKLGRAPQHVERVRPASAHPRGERREEEEEEKAKGCGT
ncbi:unnamed protein product [Prorocentrum cordatum]|uniref:Uncharacterized protein n=1 Tax=Prorocentrum cordatum TaxID=2364126 RepID=A0ABN9TGD6_9DINO|nr:unnamed protein product [Polarella glacialis]